MAGYTDKEYKNIINNSNLSYSTRAQHLRNIKKAQEISNESIDWIVSNPEKFKVMLNEHADSKPTAIHKKAGASYRKALVQPFYVMFKNDSNLRENNKQLFEKWNKVYNKLNEPIVEQNKNNEMSEREKEAYVSFDKIEEKRDNLEKGSMNRLILSMYTLIPPQRSGDFYSTKVYRKPPQGDKKNTENYIILNKNNSKLVMNDYKTYGEYGQNVINIPQTLKEEIEASLEKKPRKYLIVNNQGKPFADNENPRKDITNFINSRLKSLFNNGYYFNLIRHAYDTDRRADNEEDRKKQARAMGHSMQTQSNYVKKTITQSDDSV